MKRGRLSAADLSTVMVDARGAKPAQPPSELTDAQAQVWRDAVASMPGNWLTRGAHPILIAYCRHVCRARLLEAQVAKFKIEWAKKDGGLERLDRLLSMADRETKALTNCARQLRLSPQQVMHPKRAGRALANVLPSGPRPWD
jgi:hypothetical protein